MCSITIGQLAFIKAAWSWSWRFTIRYLVVGHYAVGQASRKLDPNLLDVARIEGASRWQMVRHAIGPQIVRPLLVSWYLIFLLVPVGCWNR